MAFILGIWMWNRYFTPVLEFDPGTEAIALVKIDRDLRLADAMAHDPAWLRKLAGARSRLEISLEALAALGKLEAWQAMSSEGVLAYQVIQATMRGTSVLRAIEQPGPLGAPAEVKGNPGEPSWWRARAAEALRPGQIADPWRDRYDQSLRTLRKRAIFLSSGMALAVVIGAIYLPFTVRRIHSAVRNPKSPGYSGAWSPALGLTVFMVATLAWIGYVGTLDLGIQKIASLPPLMALFLDTAARFLPVLIALGFLFKRPSHAFRVLGMDRRPEFKMVLGMFPLLLFADLGLRAWLGDPGRNEPGGGLSLADAGVTGLVFAIVSACLVAPVTEEILYRGVLFRSLGNRMGMLGGAVVSSAVFSAVHFYDFHGFASVGVFGFACALLYGTTGSLNTAIALHVLYNASIKIPTWIFYHARLDG